MKGSELISHAKNTWCPGCGNFVVQHTLKEVISERLSEGYPVENFVLVSGIGQHAKIFDFMNINGFYSLHGRTIPVATGIKLANPDLTVLCIAGDGDCYAEGIEHLIFAAKRNVGITVMVNNNRVYGLTTGQFTPTSPYGYRGRSTPKGEQENPLNPLDLMLASGATFIGRGYTGRREQLKSLLHRALVHKGFSFIDNLQVCATYNDLTGYYDERVYDWDSGSLSDYQAAGEKAREWDYNADTKIGLGIMYRREAPVYEEYYPPPVELPETGRARVIHEFLDSRM
jgi:2-oxoglutarate/2-oxoacid ferredoxin oxidoreductase subunit beta